MKAARRCEPLEYLAVGLEENPVGCRPPVSSQAFGVRGWNGAISPQLREKNRLRHSLVKKVTPVQPYLGACHIWGCLCVPGCPASCLDGQRKGVTVIVRSVTTGRKHSSLAFQIFGKLGVPRKQRGGGGKRPLEFLKYLNIATVVRRLPQFDSWDQPLRAALVYFASLFFRICDRVHTCQEIPGMKPIFSLPQVYAYQIVRLGLRL